MQHCTEEKDVLLLVLWNPHHCEGQPSIREATIAVRRTKMLSDSWHLHHPREDCLQRIRDRFSTLFLVFQGTYVLLKSLVFACMWVYMCVHEYVPVYVICVCMYVHKWVHVCKYVYRCMHVHEYLCMCECIYLWVHMYACTSMCHGGVIEVKRQLSGIGFLLQLSVLGVDLGSSSLHSKHLYFPGYFLCLTFPPSLLSLKKYWFKSRFE